MPVRPRPKAAEHCRTPKRGRHRERTRGACVLECGGAPPLFKRESRSSSFVRRRGDWWTRFMPASALLVGMGDLQNASFVERLA